MRPKNIAAPAAVRPHMAGASITALSALLLAGCSQGGIGTTGSLGLAAIAPGPLAYQHSNAIINAGFSETAIAPDRYRITVKGPVSTPRERMEKIAATRAAEIGKDNNLGYFKIDSVQYGIDCQRFTAGGQRGGAGMTEKKLQFAVLTAEATYVKQPPDTTFVQARPAFEQYRAELDQPQAATGLPVDPATKSAQCG